MSPAGLRFDWRKLSTVRGDEVSVELAVLTFRGRCDVEGLVTHAFHAGPLDGRM